MNENPYRSPATKGEPSVGLLKIWARPVFSIAAIAVPSVVGGAALAWDMSTPTRQPVIVHTIACLALGTWTITVLILNAIGRRSS